MTQAKHAMTVFTRITMLIVRMLRGAGVILIVAIVTCGCGESRSPVPAPTPSAPPQPTPSPAPQPRPSPRSIVLTGQVTDAMTFRPIADAQVWINGRYSATTDASGNYRIDGLLDSGNNSDFTHVSARDYFSDYRYIRGTTHNLALRRIERIVAGQTTIVTVDPNDSLCVNNVQDSPGVGPDYVCRSVRVVVPSNGIVRLEAHSTDDQTRPLLEVEIVEGPSPCCHERLENPTSVAVAAGTELVANVEMPLDSSTGRSFTLTTTILKID